MMTTITRSWITMLGLLLSVVGLLVLIGWTVWRTSSLVQEVKFVEQQTRQHTAEHSRLLMRVGHLKAEIAVIQNVERIDRLQKVHLPDLRGVTEYLGVEDIPYFGENGYAR